MFNLKFGFTVLLMSVLPISYIIKVISAGGMYGLIFKQFPPYVYVSFQLLAQLIIAYLIISFLVKKSDLEDRLPITIPAQKLLLIGSIVILIPQILRIFTSMVPGGGMSYALMTYAAPFMIIGKLLLIIGAVKILMSVEPDKKYEYI